MRAARLALVLALALAMPLPARAQAATPRADSSGIRYLYLIRHGDYARHAVDDDRVQGPLTPLGHEQARLIAARLKALPVRFSALVSSNYLRAMETADDIGAVLGMTPVRDSLLHECSFHSYRTLANTTEAEMSACDSNAVHAWAKYFTASRAQDTHELLVCHGNVIRWMVCRAIGADTRRWPAFDIANGSLTIVAVRPDGTSRLVEYSDTGHLPLDKQTWTGKGAGWGAPTPRSNMK
jgi:serine/threonine-protein phosphatase PGAM5